MNFVQSMKDIEKNCETINSYLSKPKTEYYSYAINLIQRGRCFYVIKENNHYTFYPSRFIGYKNNTMNKHQHNLDKDGRETNPIITSILHVKTCAPNETLENEYIRYCNSLDIKPYKYKRKYWIK